MIPLLGGIFFGRSRGDGTEKAEKGLHFSEKRGTLLNSKV